ncbi:Hypothetical protein AA314_01666 [Archangium gephyra]|uniref:Uncharacterized protein n=1 Tax=Archangium gephyra TaxID=48 RepID=A0AAC8Q2U1_9BACT|nr:Hypothetical protein AA314_01666 [Archangium gephyra]
MPHAPLGLGEIADLVARYEGHGRKRTLESERGFAHNPGPPPRPSREPLEFRTGLVPRADAAVIHSTAPCPPGRFLHPPTPGKVPRPARPQSRAAGGRATCCRVIRRPRCARA